MKSLHCCNINVSSIQRKQKITNHFLAGFLAVHETFWNDIWREKLVTLFELLEENTVWKALSADANSLQHTITPQLIEHQWRVYFAGLQPTTGHIL